MASTKPQLLRNLHVEFIRSLDNKKDSLEYHLTSHLKLNGVYWGLTALDLLGRLDVFEKEDVITFILACQHSNGGFSGNVGHDPHLLYTLSAVQILATLDSLDRIDSARVVDFVKNLQDPESGAFCGDIYGEVDTRFVYVAISCMSILSSLDQIDVDKAVEYINRCKNFDGGYGSVPGAESHSGQIFCCVGALSIVNRLDTVDIDKLGWWLCERQLSNGGLNGRPEKKEDVCYSWWVLSSLAMLDRLHWIDHEKLIEFILGAQDDEAGGIADRPGDMADVFHTVFGLAGLSLLGYPDLKPVDPRYCMTRDVTKRLGL
ncbi:terpenoid cyclases/protein prenyltransferase alpha-alpha toroid [Polychytrium aggregatum]|uniref:terpenoid cyclases/protein prenyltransferase alpha-alpha toroid n=1 Tax=Polychytrium aggregatum TaxID=110093 RepID=UPI0022FEC8A6|nr:terpenoid cyclases/protein prenyltransferase alpha-alpha toroid [Polychytrium aggregatum]KAI9206317.1 terpenoid cyclases/protein prenyltransferase alpha-alpha toroid [Polychytrium aggregatum]